MLSVNLTHLIDDAKSYETVSQMRWIGRVSCPKSKSSEAIKRDKDETHPARQRYQYKTCNTTAVFDRTNHKIFPERIASQSFQEISWFNFERKALFAGHHQPLRMWILCLYLMGLNRSN